MEQTGKRLRAVVVGAGWAGEGLTLALRDTGVEVVAICARNAEVVGKVAQRLSVPEGSTDWREAIARLRPEIVAIGTPGSVRREVVEAAVAVGAHILCDKPLALTGEDAADVYRMVRTAGVRHAYASTHQYNPSVAWVRELLGQGIIGVLQQVQVSLAKRFFPPIGPWVWFYDLASGGGMLNNGATHVFGILERLVGGEITGATGWADRTERMLPVVPGTRVSWGGEGLEFTPEAAAQYPQRMANADMQHIMLLRLSTATGDVHGTLQLMTVASSEPNRWRLMGTTGELIGYGVLGFNRIMHVPHDGGEATEHPVPDRFVAALPGIESDLGRYTALLRDFVADIRNEPHASYPTFRDGWRYQVAIDAIRNSRGIPPVPHDL